MVPAKLSPDEEAKEFMLAEYQTLRELRIAQDAIGDSRVNYYLAIISASLVGVALLNQLSAYRDVVFFINIAVYAGLLLFGLVTFARTVERSVTNIAYTNGMNRIRQYFVERHPHLESYVELIKREGKTVPPSALSYIYDQRARRTNATGLSVLVLIINSMVATVGVVVFMRIGLSMAMLLAVIGGLIAFAIIVYLQYLYAVTRLRHASLTAGAANREQVEERQAKCLNLHAGTSAARPQGRKTC